MTTPANFTGFVGLPTNATLNQAQIAQTGGNQAHPNTQPTLAMIYCICSQGIFPSFS